MTAKTCHTEISAPAAVSGVIRGTLAPTGAGGGFADASVIAFDEEFTATTSLLSARIDEDAQQTGCGTRDPQDGPCLSVSELLAFHANPDDTIAGNGWLRKRALSLMTGGTGIGKSVLVMQLAVNVSDGQDILGRIVVNKKHRVLLAQAENDEETIQRDLASCIENTLADVAGLDARLFIRRPAHRAAEFLQWLDAECGRCTPDLIVVDNYQSFVGAVDINATSGCLEFLQGVQRVIDTHGAGLLLVAHTPKPRERDNWNHRELVYMAAGTSALANWARTSCELLTAGKETERFRLTFSKNAERAGLRDETAGIIRELYLSHSGNPSRPFWHVADDQGAPQTGQYTEAIRKLLDGNPDATLGEVMKATGCAKSTASRIRREVLS